MNLCEVCGIPSTSKCSLCHKSSYCGKEHQTLDWKRHKDECTRKEECDYADEFSKLMSNENEVILKPQLKRSLDFVQRAKNNGRPPICKGIIFPTYQQMIVYDQEKTKALEESKIRSATLLYTNHQSAIVHTMIPALETLRKINLSEISDSVNKIHWVYIYGPRSLCKSFGRSL